MEEFSDNYKLIRISTKLIRKPNVKANPDLVKLLLKKGYNRLPIVVFETGYDEYTAISNAHVLAAAIKAKLDFVWVILITENDDHDQLQEELKFTE